MISKMIDGQEVLMSGTSEALIAQKADKVASATNGDIASLDATGNLTDSGVKGDVSTTTLNGNPLSFTTDSEQAARECVITFEPIQAGSGDPSPSNVRAISGYDKVIININLWDTTFSEWEKYLASDGTEVELNNFCISSYIEVEPNCEYRYNIPLGITSNAPAICWYDANKTYIGGEATSNRNEVYITTPNNAKYIRFSVYQANINYRLYKLPLIFSYSEPLPETVYGGTLNVETGELVVTHKIIDLGNYTWSKTGNAFWAESPHDFKIISTRYSGQTPYYNGSGVSDSHKFADFPTDAGNYTLSLFINGSNNQYRLWVYDDNSMTSEQFNTYIAGKKLCYLLADEYKYTIQLTPAQVRLLQGNNVVTTNGTSIKLTYRNGEVATLADVSSVAESVNALGGAAKQVTLIGEKGDIETGDTVTLTDSLSKFTTLILVVYIPSWGTVLGTGIVITELLPFCRNGYSTFFSTTEDLIAVNIKKSSDTVLEISSVSKAGGWENVSVTLYIYAR